MGRELVSWQAIFCCEYGYRGLGHCPAIFDYPIYGLDYLFNAFDLGTGLWNRF
jgi:hypothetical protein